MVEILESFSTRLDRALEIREKKPADLARATGISESTISQYRSGYSKPKDDRLVLIANVLRVDPAWLMGLDVPMDATEAKLYELAEEKAVHDQISSLDLTPLELEFVELFVKLPAEKKTLIIQIMKSYL